MKLPKLTVLSCAFVIVLLAGNIAQAQNFNGFYVGANLGGSLGRANAATTAVPSGSDYLLPTDPADIAAAGAMRLNGNNFTGGIQAGYNFQKGSFLVGLESEFGYMALNKTHSNTATYTCCAPFTFTIDQSVETSWHAGLRPRAGFVWGRTLLYGTGGFAITDLNYRAMFTDNDGFALETGGVKKTAVGWSAGGGAEFRVADHVLLRGEYLYEDYGRSTITSTNLQYNCDGVCFAPGDVFTHSTDLRAHLVRFAINYRF